MHEVTQNYLIGTIYSEHDVQQGTYLPIISVFSRLWARVFFYFFRINVDYQTYVI